MVRKTNLFEQIFSSNVRNVGIILQENSYQHFSKSVDYNDLPDIVKHLITLLGVK